MKICIAQTKSIKGEIIKNIDNHIKSISKAIDERANLIVFPELSITGYEPTIANQLATVADDAIFDIFQEKADIGEIVISIGMPLKTAKGVNIGMIIFQPNQERCTYAKRMLHADEIPFFIPGEKQFYLKLSDHNIAFGICYETLQSTHFLQAINDGASIYIASVAKSRKGIEKAMTYFPSVAKQYKIPILMSNCIGNCDGFIGAGLSSSWDNKGSLMYQLDDNKEGILTFHLE